MLTILPRLVQRRVGDFSGYAHVDAVSLAKTVSAGVKGTGKWAVEAKDLPVSWRRDKGVEVSVRKTKSQQSKHIAIVAGRTMRYDIAMELNGEV
jgi:hypothetical protein